MNQDSVAQQILERVRALPDEEQRRVLEFVRSLRTSRIGTPGTDLLRFAGAIDRDELESMSQAIEEGCEQVDVNEW